MMAWVRRIWSVLNKPMGKAEQPAPCPRSAGQPGAQRRCTGRPGRRYIQGPEPGRRGTDGPGESRTLQADRLRTDAPGRRTSERIEERLPIKVTSPDGVVCSGWTANLGASGVCIRCGRVWWEGTVLELSLREPTDPERGRRSRPRWSGPRSMASGASG